MMSTCVRVLSSKQQIRRWEGRSVYAFYKLWKREQKVKVVPGADHGNFLLLTSFRTFHGKEIDNRK